MWHLTSNGGACESRLVSVFIPAAVPALHMVLSPTCAKRRHRLVPTPRRWRVPLHELSSDLTLIMFCDRFGHSPARHLVLAVISRLSIGAASASDPQSYVGLLLPDDTDSCTACSGEINPPRQIVKPSCSDFSPCLYYVFPSSSSPQCACTSAPHLHERRRVRMSKSVPRQTPSNSSPVRSSDGQCSTH
jgi:hypothetical protein